MRWREIIAKYFKFAFVGGLIVVSTIAFFIWRAIHDIRHAPAKPPPDLRPQMAKVEANHERMLLVDNDLYDVETGELIFKNWLKNGMPVKLFWEADSKTVLAQYERGFVRYALDGTPKASLTRQYQFGIADDYRWIVFSRDKEIWLADVNWKDLETTNERKLTSIGRFNDQNFAGNIVLGTEKTLIVLNGNKVLHVNFDTGEVKPMEMSLLDIKKRTSPDSKSVVGLENGRFYCYDVDTDVAKYIPVGRGTINDYQWLGNDRCVAIAAGKAIIFYDRKNNSLTELAALPFFCDRIGEPSPGVGFVFCSGRGSGVLVDIDKRSATPVAAGEGVRWINGDAFAFSRDVQNSALRGTWLQKVGEGERRISPEPYLVGNAGGFIMAIPPGNLVVFAIKKGLAKMNLGGSALTEIVTLARAPERALAIQKWQQW